MDEDKSQCAPLVSLLAKALENDRAFGESVNFKNMILSLLSNVTLSVEIVEAGIQWLTPDIIARADGMALRDLSRHMATVASEAKYAHVLAMYTKRLSREGLRGWLEVVKGPSREFVVELFNWWLDIQAMPVEGRLYKISKTLAEALVPYRHAIGQDEGALEKSIALVRNTGVTKSEGCISLLYQIWPRQEALCGIYQEYASRVLAPNGVLLRDATGALDVHGPMCALAWHTQYGAEIRAEILREALKEVPRGEDLYHPETFHTEALISLYRGASAEERASIIVVLKSWLKPIGRRNLPATLFTAAISRVIQCPVLERELFEAVVGVLVGVASEYVTTQIIMRLGNELLEVYLREYFSKAPSQISREERVKELRHRFVHTPPTEKLVAVILANTKGNFDLVNYLRNKRLPGQIAQ